MEREKLEAYLKQGMSNLQIAKAEGISEATVRKWLGRYGLRNRQSKFDPAPKPRKKCANCENLVNKRYNIYCTECIAKGVYRAGYGDTLEDCKTDRRRKIKILEERGHRCESCGLTEWLEQPIKLELHHIDGDADNNNRDNLQLLCLNCHSLTPTFRAKNKANGTNRRKIYRKKYYNS
jgi:transposase